MKDSWKPLLKTFAVLLVIVLFTYGLPIEEKLSVQVSAFGSVLTYFGFDILRILKKGS